MPETKDLPRELSVQDSTRLAELELIVDAHIDSVWAVRDALAEIQEKKYWQIGGYSSFKEYAEARFGTTIGHVYRQLSAAKTAAKIESVSPEMAPVINNERKLRALTNLDDEELSETLELAKETATDPDNISSTHLERSASVVKARRNSSEQIASDTPDAWLKTVKENANRVVNSVTSDLNKIRQRLQDAELNISGLEILASRRVAIVRLIDEAISSSRGSVPKKLCGKCFGRKCSDCGLRGWV